MPVLPNTQRSLEAVLQRAAADPAFRQRLLTAPREAIQEAFGVIVPPTFRVKFIERGPDVDALIVLPDFEPDDRPPLPPLDRVTGGASPRLAAAGWVSGAEHR